MSKLVIAFFLTLSICFSAIAIPLPISLPPENSFHNIQFSNSDLLLAKYYQDLLKHLKEGNIHVRSLNSILKILNPESSFFYLMPYLKKLKILSTQFSNNSGLLNLCLNNKEQKNNEHPDIRLIRAKSQEICLKEILSHPVLDAVTNNSLVQLVDVNMESIVEGKLKFVLASFLKEIKTNISLYKKISSLISRYYIESNRKVDKIILENIAISDDLTAYIQHSRSFDDRSTKYFINEFQNLISQINVLLVNGNFSEAQKISSQLLSFDDQNSDFLPRMHSWKAFTSLARKLDSFGQRVSAKEHFLYAIKIAPPSEASEAYFQLLWHFVSNKDHVGATAYINQFNLIKNFSDFDTKLKFWIAKSTENAGDTYLAKYLYRNIIENSPLSFYSILSLKRLYQYTEKASQNMLSSINGPSELLKFNIEDYKPNITSAISRLRIWATLENDSQVTNEVAFLIGLNPQEIFQNEKIWSELSKNTVAKHMIDNVTGLLNNKQLYLQTFKIIYSSLGINLFNVNRTTLKRLFPTEYVNTIKKLDSQIDPLIVLSVIRQESAFNPLALSSVGASGLMQLMPETAKSVLKNVKKNQLHDPEINIDAGIKYLKYLLSKYDGNLVYALISYNAGETRLRQWRSNVFTSEDPLVMIESIPFNETRNYVKYIFRNIFFYQLLANKADLDVPMKENIKVTFN